MKRTIIVLIIIQKNCHSMCSVFYKTNPIWFLITIRELHSFKTLHLKILLGEYVFTLNLIFTISSQVNL